MPTSLRQRTSCAVAVILAVTVVASVPAGPASAAILAHETRSAGASRVFCIPVPVDRT